MNKDTEYWRGYRAGAAQATPEADMVSRLQEKVAVADASGVRIR